MKENNKIESVQKAITIYCAASKRELFASIYFLYC